MKLRFALALSAVICLLFAAPATAFQDKRLEGVVDLQKLSHSLDLRTFSSGKKSPGTDAEAREILQEAGWVPNSKGIFTLRMGNKMLTFRGDEKLKHFYVLPFTRNVIAEKNMRPVMTGSFVVVDENLEGGSYAKMTGFGYIGRGSHTRGERYGFLPFNQDFIRLLARDKITSYIFTITDMNVEDATERRREFELYFKCRFSDKSGDYIRRQSNVKLSSADSPNSRRIMEYMLCVDVVGAFVYNSKTGRVVREWSIKP